MSAICSLACQICVPPVRFTFVGTAIAPFVLAKTVVPALMAHVPVNVLESDPVSRRVAVKPLPELMMLPEPPESTPSITRSRVPAPLERKFGFAAIL